MRKIIQLIRDTDGVLIALADDGTLWLRGSEFWAAWDLGGLPQPYEAGTTEKIPSLDEQLKAQGFKFNAETQCFFLESDRLFSDGLHKNDFFWNAYKGQWVRKNAAE